MRSYHEVAGDGGSGVAEQVAELRSRVASNLAAVKHRVAIGSGKGGVGKSTLTYLLASALLRQGRRVAILDADLNGPSQARLTGLRKVTLIPTAEGVALPLRPDGLGVVSLGSLVPESEQVDFASVAKGDSHIWRATQEFTLLQQLLAAVEWGRLDYLFFDLPPGAERTFQYAEALGPETAVVLVSIPSDLARGVVARSVAALAATANPVLGYVENMKGYYCSECQTIRPLFPDGEEVSLEIPLLGAVPFDPDLAAACDRGGLLVDRPAARAVEEVAGRLVQSLEDER